MSNKSKGASFGALFSVASVWFGSHAGGGFATGNQTTQYYVQYGWFAPIMALLAMAILACVIRECILMYRNHNFTNYKEMLEAGADMLVAGSDIFKNNAIQDNINSFK